MSTLSNAQANLNADDIQPIRPTEAALVAESAQESAQESVHQPAYKVAQETAQDMATADAFAVDTTIDIAEAKRALEAVLLAASEPLPLPELKKIFDGSLSVDIVRELLDVLREEWAGRSVELALVASGYRFRIKPDYQKYLDRLSNEKPPRYSRAVLETLAIIAYRQPVTRADIEDIRGVAVSPHILKTLEDRGWIDEIGHKDAPGRPALFATTRHFLDDLNLRSLDALPALHELQATLDMSQAGVVGAAYGGGETPSLPGVADYAGMSNDSADGADEPVDAKHNPENTAAEIEPQDDPHDEPHNAQLQAAHQAPNAIPHHDHVEPSPDHAHPSSLNPNLEPNGASS